MNHSPRKVLENKVVNSIWGKWTHQWNLWCPYIIDYYSSRMMTWNTHKYLKEDLVIFSRYFTSSFSSIVFFIMALQTLMHKQTSGLKSRFILYTFSFCCVMYYLVLEIDNGRLFLEDCFYCYSQQIISTVAKESLISYNLRQRAPETQNLKCCNTIYYPNQIKQM